MNYSFLLPLLLIGFLPFAFADIEHGKNYDKEILDINPNGFPIVKHTSLAYDRISFNGAWQDYAYTNYSTYHEIKTALTIIHLNKSTCAYSFYDQNNNHMFGDSIIAFNSIVNLYSWNVITQVNNATCDAYYDESTGSLVAKKYAPGIGMMEYKYIFDNGKWKTQLEATNLSALTNRVFAFDQTIDLKRDIIKFGKYDRNLDEFNGTTFDRSWLVTNEAKVIDFLNNFNIDLDLGFNYLDSVTVTDTGSNSSKLTFHYMKNNQILLPNETMIIDPTYSGIPTSENANVANDATPASCNGKSVTGTAGVVQASTDPTICRIPWQTFTLTGIPSYAVVINATYTYDLTTATSTVPCYLFDYPSTPGSGQATYDVVFTAAGIATKTTDCQSTGDGKIFVMNSTGITKIQENISGNEGFYALGLWLVTEPSGESVIIRPADSTLEIVYIDSILLSVSDLNVEIVGDAAKIDGTITIEQLAKTNVTSIILLVNGTIINTNSTGYNSTVIPYDVNFGPLWYQIPTDELYNFTIQVNAQNSTRTVSNSTSNLTTREYDPDYFTAIDPTQGLVNYTFTDDNFLQVNRNTNSSVFNVECIYFTQAQAFQNDLSSGTWDNQSDILFYISDASGYYYVQCYNDGELFVTAIQQNFTNALVPGLVIFDQLGGFFGAPSIILVIISILSLGTGRNYPIVMLIAASVTGILLALELLVLDPGLVVALIVMTGFGLFGIRKFY